MNKYFAASLILLASSAAQASVWDIPAGTTSTGGNVPLTQNVYGTAINYTVTGTQNVQSGGLAQNSIIYSGALQDVKSGGRSENTRILYNGNQYVRGISQSSTIDSGGRIYVYSGGQAYGTVVNGGQISVYAGGNTYNTVVNSGYQYISGTDQSAVLNNGARQTVRSGGTVSAATVNTGARQQVEFGGTADGTTINGGTMSVYGIANNLILNDGDVFAYSGSSLANPTINNGFMDINAADVDNLTINGGEVQAFNESTINKLSMYGGTAILHSGVEISGDTTVNNADLILYTSQNFGTLNLDNGNITLRHSDTASNITVDTLNGDGNFYLTGNLSENTADHLQISGGSGTYGITLHDYSSSGSLPDTVNLVTSPDNGEQFYLIGDAVDIGAYQYNLLHDGSKWILQRSFNNTESAIIAKNTYSTLSTIFYSHLQNLNTRLGELRFNGASGLWIRGFGGNARIRHDDESKTKINTVGTQFGFDYLLKQNFISRWLIGIYGGLSDTRNKFNFAGRGDINTYSGGVYSTMFSADGYYLDLVGSYYRSRQKITSYTPAGMDVHGKYDLDAWAVSLETGRRFRFQSGIFIEPQAQIQYMDLGNISYRTNFNTLIKGSDFNTSIGRLGIMGGREFMLGEMPVEAFLKISLLHDFDHKSTVSVADYVFTEDNADTTWQFGAGFNAGITPAASSYFNISTTSSSDVSIPLNINLGLRWEF